MNRCIYSEKGKTPSPSNCLSLLLTDGQILQAPSSPGCHANHRQACPFNQGRSHSLPNPAIHTTNYRPCLQITYRLSAFRQCQREGTPTTLSHGSSLAHLPMARTVHSRRTRGRDELITSYVTPIPRYHRQKVQLDFRSAETAYSVLVMRSHMTFGVNIRCDCECSERSMPMEFVLPNTEHHPSGLWSGTEEIWGIPSVVGRSVILCVTWWIRRGWKVV